MWKEFLSPLLVIIAAGAFGFSFFHQQIISPTTLDETVDVSGPLPDDVPDMAAVFRHGTTNDQSKTQARYDAICAAAICADQSGVLKFDGELPQPFLTTEAQVEEIRVLTSMYKRGGVSFLTRYPNFVDAVNEFFGKRVRETGQDTSELTVPIRLKWIRAYDDLRRACNIASTKI